MASVKKQIELEYDRLLSYLWETENDYHIQRWDTIRVECDKVVESYWDWFCRKWEENKPEDEDELYERVIKSIKKNTHWDLGFFDLDNTTLEQLEMIMKHNLDNEG